MREGLITIHIHQPISKDELETFTDVTIYAKDKASVPHTISAHIKKVEIDPANMIIKIDDSRVGLVFHYDLETLDNSLEEYDILIVGSHIFKRIV